MFRQFLLATAVLIGATGAASADYSNGKLAYDGGDYTTAYQEFQASADRNHTLSQYMIGRLYASGTGVGRDDMRAYMWYDIAAANGYTPAASARDIVAGRLNAYQVEQARRMAAEWRVVHPRYVAAPPPTPPTAIPYSPSYSIRNLQQALNDLGYAAGAADGVVGQRTRAAIRAFQVDSGLPVSGEPSLSVFDHLQRAKAARMQAAVPQPSPVSLQLVADTQAELRQRGYSIPTVTGELDAATIAAIRAYQADARLTVTGQASESLLAQLRSASTASGATYREQVKRLQTALNSRGYDAGPADGALGPKTRTAIRTYQADAGLPVTGEISANLLAQLEGGAGATTPSPTTGDSLVAQIQGELLRHDYAVGDVDGIADNQTRLAIRTYQRDAGLAATGEATQSLLAHLRSSSVHNTGDTASLLVWKIENQLERHGYAAGPVDGTVDQQTAEAILAYEEDADLDKRGQPTLKLLRHLETSTVHALSGSGSTMGWKIEDALSRKGYDVGTVDGMVDAETRAAIRAYQEDARLDITGVANLNLLRHLESSDVRAMSSGDISEIESQLDRRGYVTGPIDGIVDAQTTVAIRAFQTDAALAVTGQPSVGLLAELRRSNVTARSSSVYRSFMEALRGDR
jgi:peptidoglycan hydrolase-like protein with peptidoglycan-binding domain